MRRCQTQTHNIIYSGIVYHIGKRLVLWPPNIPITLLPFITRVTAPVAPSGLIRTVPPQVPRLTTPKTRDPGVLSRPQHHRCRPTVTVVTKLRNVLIINVLVLLLTWPPIATTCRPKVLLIPKVTSVRKTTTWVEIIEISGTVVATTSLIVPTVVPRGAILWPSTVPERHERLVSAFFQ